MVTTGVSCTSLAMIEKKCDSTNITRMANIRKFLNKLRHCGVGPSGQLTKLTILKHALTMVVIHSPDDDASADTVTLASSIATVQVQIARIMKSLRKECTSIRKRKRDMFDTTALDHRKVLSFVRDKKLLALIQSWVQKDTLTEQELLTISAFGSAPLLSLTPPWPSCRGLLPVSETVRLPASPAFPAWSVAY